MGATDPNRRRGVVILGVPRSGTTLLRRLFDAHPSFACPGETFLLTAAAKFLASQSVANGLEVGVLAGLSFEGFPEEEVVQRLRAFTFAFLEERARRADKPRWAEKTAADVFHLREIELLCGEEVEYVCLLRHALDCVVSLNELVASTQRWSIELHPYVARNPRPLEALGAAWCDGTRAMLDLVERRPDRARIVRYEDLVSRPAATMSALMRSLHESWPRGLEASALTGGGEPGLGDWKIYKKRVVDASSVGRGQAELSRVTMLELAPIVNQTLVACGYEPLPTGPLPSQGRARRLYQAAMKVQPLRRR